MNKDRMPIQWKSAFRIDVRDYDDGFVIVEPNANRNILCNSH